MENMANNMNKSFFEKLAKRWSEFSSLICVGLDSDFDRIPFDIKKRSMKPRDNLFQFNREIIDATADLVCAYKPNIAFYEYLGSEGLSALSKTNEYIHLNYPDIPIIVDAKRGDIENTNRGYIKAIFEIFQADAVTINPYFGQEAVQLFLDQEQKGIFILCRTSNPGAGEFQDLRIIQDNKTFPLYQYLALQVASKWNTKDNCGLVMGATYPMEIQEVRKLVGDIPFLVPGVGAQAGNLEQTVKAGLNSKGTGLIINSARQIIFASGGKDFAEAARKEAQRLRDEVNQYR